MNGVKELRVSMKSMIRDRGGILARNVEREKVGWKMDVWNSDLKSGEVSVDCKAQSMIIGVREQGRIEEHMAGYEKSKEQSVLNNSSFCWSLLMLWKMCTNRYLEMDPPSLQDVNALLELRSTCVIYSSVNQVCPLWLYNYQLWCSLWNIMKYKHIKLKIPQHKFFVQYQTSPNTRF